MPKVVAQKIDWIKLGHQRFAAEGINGIVIEKMAKKLACNKSSFYWHFKTKKEFIQQIIAHWILIETNQIISLTNKKLSPKGKFEVLTALAFKKKPHLDFIFYLKRHALQNKKIQKIIDDIDKQRIQYVTDLLLEIGFSKQDAKVKAALYYKFLIGYHEMIRYKKQSKNYIKEVKAEMKHFIKF